jgi:hypothetical protein
MIMVNLTLSLTLNSCLIFKVEGHGRDFRPPRDRQLSSAKVGWNRTYPFVGDEQLLGDPTASADAKVRASVYVAIGKLGQKLPSLVNKDASMIQVMFVLSIALFKGLPLP